MLIFRDWAYDVALLLARRHRMMTKCEIAERLGNLDIQGSRRRSGASRENGAKRLSQALYETPKHKCHMAERAAFSASARRALRGQAG